MDVSQLMSNDICIHGVWPEHQLKTPMHVWYPTQWAVIVLYQIVYALLMQAHYMVFVGCPVGSEALQHHGCVWDWILA